MFLKMEWKNMGKNKRPVPILLLLVLAHSFSLASSWYVSSSPEAKQVGERRSLTLKPLMMQSTPMV